MFYAPLFKKWFTFHSSPSLALRCKLQVTSDDGEVSEVPLGVYLLPLTYANLHWGSMLIYYTALNMSCAPPGCRDMMRQPVVTRRRRRHRKQSLIAFGRRRWHTAEQVESSLFRL